MAGGCGQRGHDMYTLGGGPVWRGDVVRGVGWWCTIRMGTRSILLECMVFTGQWRWGEILDLYHSFFLHFYFSCFVRLAM